MSYRSQPVPKVEDNISYEDKLWNLLERNMGREQKYLKNNIYASCANCSKYNALTLGKEVNNNSSPSLNMFASLGNCIESFVAESLEKSGTLISTQYKPPLHPNDAPLRISGIIDILYLNDLNEVAILEVKSTGLIDTKEVLSQNKDGKLIKSKRYGITKTGPPIAHLTQILLYSALTGIKDASILYLARNVVEKFGNEIAHHIYKVDTSYDNLLKVISEIYYAQLCANNNIIPVRPANYKKTVECKFCDLKSDCWANAPEEETTAHIELKLEAIELGKIFMDNSNLRKEILLNDLVNRGKLSIR